MWIGLLATSLDRVWVRDTFAVFLTSSQRKLAGIDFNFNGRCGKQTHANDKEVAQRLLEFTDAEGINTSIVAEGGAIEVDGQGTAIITVFSLLSLERRHHLVAAEILLSNRHGDEV